MPVPIPGSKVGSDIQKVKFLTISGRPKTGFFRKFRGVPGRAPLATNHAAISFLGRGFPQPCCISGGPRRLPKRSPHDPHPRPDPRSINACSGASGGRIRCLEQCKWDARGVPGGSWVGSWGFLKVSRRFYIRKHSQNLPKFDPNQARKSGQIYRNP